MLHEQHINAVDNTSQPSELSIYQQELYLDQLLNPGSPMYNVGFYFSIKGKLNAAILLEAVQATCRRHEQLRLQITSDENGEYRLSLSDSPLPVAEESIEQAWTAEDFRDRLATFERQAFSFDNTPLMAVKLYCYQDDVTLAAFRFHHILADARGVQFVEKEIVEHYNGAIQGQIPILPCDEGKYGAFVAEANHYKASKRFADDRAFWRQELRNADDSIFDQAQNQSLRTLPNRRETLPIDVATYNEIKHWCEENGFTLFQYLVAVKALLCASLFNKKTIAIGLPLLNRRAKFKEDVGLFTNIIPALISVDRHLSFRDFLAFVKRKLMSIFRHQQLPFGEIVRLWHEQGKTGLPFDLKISYEQYQLEEGFTGLETSRTLINNHSQNHALSIFVRDFSSVGNVSIDFDFVDDFIGHSIDIQSVISTFASLFQSLHQRAECSLADLPLLSASDSHWILHTFNDTAVAIDNHKTLVSTFEEAVARYPDRTALVFGDKQLSYRRLDSLSNKVAHYLLANGVRCGDVVGLQSFRSFELVIGIFGILKAGCAYVPLDPSHPAERSHYILNHSGCRLILLGEDVSFESDSVLVGSIRAICESTMSAENPGVDVTPDMLAYILYTSGSTGRPKGVMVEHRGVINRIDWQQKHYPLVPDSTLLQKTPYGFDVSVWELFWWMFAGARLHLLPPGDEKRPDHIVSALTQQGVTAIHFVPSMLGVFLEYLDTIRHDGITFPALHYVICSGEALTGTHARTFHALMPQFNCDAQLVNLYGPTEASIDVSYFVSTRDNCLQHKAVPIGRPVDNTQLFVLNESGQLLPPGIAGELHIGGIQLARGYHNNPELTQEKFFYHAPLKQRLYKTGDLVRLLSSGDIEYLGRLDHQVKIRGNRIELGEIEHAVLQYEGVREAVVIKLTDAHHEDLCCYFVGAHAVAHDALRLFIRERLPVYMVPTFFVQLERLPLSANGKLERRALPAPCINASQQQDADVVCTKTEALLIRLIQDHLSLHNITPNDNFFLLGIDSIRIIRLQTRARQQGIHFTLADIYEHHTIAALAAHIDAKADVNVVAPIRHLEPFALIPSQYADQHRGICDDVFPASALQMGLIYHSLKNPASAVYHDIFRYRLALSWNESAFRNTVEALVRKHAALRLSFDIAHQDQPLARVHKRIEANLKVEPIEHLDLLAQSRCIERYIQARKQHRFIWNEAPLFEFCVFSTGEKIELVFSFHHAILDGWSVATLISELLIGYTRRLDAGAADDSTADSASKTSLANYVSLELDAINNGDDRRFWQHYLEGITGSSIKSWSPYHAPAEAENASFTATLPAALGDAATAFAREHKMPLKTVFLAAHGMALARLCDQGEVITGLVQNGRPETEDADKTLGLFLNTLPIRIDTRHPSLEQKTLAQLTRALLDAEGRVGNHRRYPLSHILQDLETSSLFDTVFNYTDFFVLKDALDNHGITLESWEADESTNFDLLVNIGRHPANGLYTFKIDYHTRALPQAQIAYYVDQFIQALSQIEPSLATFSDTCNQDASASTLADENTTVTALLNHALATHGAQIALSDGRRDISYHTLDTLSAQLAGVLQKNNIGPGSRVGVALPRSIELMVTVIAIVRVGAAYVPMDMNYPQARIQQVLEDTSPHLLVLDDAARDRLGPLPQGTQTATWDQLIASETAPFDSARADVDADTPLYILFTSGSTGRPKGVVMPQGPLANLLTWQLGEDIVSGPALKTLQYSPIAFDVSFQEIFSSLMAGGTLYVIEETLRYDLARLLTFIDQHAITRIFIPNAALQYLSETALHNRTFPAALNHINVAGEQLKVSAEVRQFISQLNHCVLSNHYGPTEAHVVTALNLTGDPHQWPSLPPIGQAITNTQVWVADAKGAPVPVGTPGDILIAGVCLASGYWQRPDLTAERFIDVEQNGRWMRAYKTGDIGVQLPSGDIACFGRADGQVKIRGYRVELAEIELVLQTFIPEGSTQALSQVAVIAKQDSQGQSCLAAFVQAGSSGVDLVKLKAFLQCALPEYMVPPYLTAVDAMPIGPTGKIDRNALSQRPLAPLEQTAYAPPSAQTEHLLHGIWCTLLDRATLSIDDDFFDVGGNSLKAVRLVSQVEKATGHSLALASFMSAPTIRLLAKQLDAPMKLGAANGCVVPFAIEKNKPTIFMVHPIGGNVLCYAGLSKAIKGRSSLYGLQAPGIWDDLAPIDNIPQLAAHYVDHILSVCPEGDITLGGWSFGGFVAFQMAVELQRRGRRVNNLFLFDSIVLRKRTPVDVSDNQLLNWFLWELLAGDWQTGHKVDWVDFSSMSSQQAFAEIKNRAVNIGLLDRDLSLSIVDRLFQVFKANWHALLQYELPVYHPPVTLFAAKNTLPDVLLDPHSIVESAHEDAFRGWAPYIPNINKIEVDGDHLTLMMSPNIDQVANHMIDIIEHSANQENHA